MPVNEKKEAEFIRLLALGVPVTAAAKAVNYGSNERYRKAIRRMAKRDLERLAQEQAVA